MKIALLTTETTHHTFFLKELVKYYQNIRVFIEQKSLKPTFDTHHPFEDMQIEYEQNVLLGGDEVTLSKFAETVLLNSVNDTESVTSISGYKPDVIVVFGTGYIKDQVIDIAPGRIINLHGGDPEEYRGLDTHMWAIYHRDNSGLVTTLHHVNKVLDNGRIILQENIPAIPGMQIYELRRYNTEVCIRLVVSVLAMYEKLGQFISRPQRQNGRYYSFMPSTLKEICVKRFTKYIEKVYELYG